ncbi:MAG TPA: hypothetical protein VMF06_18775 [Candidatus Limnocylindria bacterium]|jgi:hypothetical protein|nr:hypothetical protein [Candidatus Limnocylindria bacterium]
MNDKFRMLLWLFSRKPSEWNGLLPLDEKAVYLARGTAFIARHPLVGCAYELWNHLDHLALDHSDPEAAARARLRMILQVIFDCGSTDHINCDVGRADRWDAYWGIVHELAARCVPDDEPFAPIDFLGALEVVEIRSIKDPEEYYELKENWRHW